MDKKIEVYKNSKGDITAEVAYDNHNRVVYEKRFNDRGTATESKKYDYFGGNPDDHDAPYDISFYNNGKIWKKEHYYCRSLTKTDYYKDGKYIGRRK